MSRTVMGSLALSLALAFCWLPPGAAENGKDAVSGAKGSTVEYRPGEVLVKMKARKGFEGRAVLKNRLRVKSARTFRRTGVELWRLPPDTTVGNALRELRVSAEVEFAEPNYVRRLRALPDDPGLDRQWGVDNAGQPIDDPSADRDWSEGGAPGADMDLDRAWDLTTGSDEIVIAIVDDSLEMDHPDLAGNLWTNPGETPDNGVDDDGNGYVDDMHGWDFTTDDNNTSADVEADFTQGHGTAVAGCAGAVGDNGEGVSGAAWRVSLMALKTDLSIAQNIEAFEYAIENGAHVVNASFGGFEFSRAEAEAMDALEEAGILVVVAAGSNDGDNDRVPDYPSGLPNGNILSVTASDPLDRLVQWSHYGATSVDVAAPGISVYTTMAPSTSRYFGNSAQPGLEYDYIDGTSFSTPYTAGVGALVKSRFPAADYREMKGRILAGGDGLQSRQGLSSTDGRVNAYGALTAQPSPVLVIHDVAVLDPLGNGNGLPDPGETVEIDVALENVWEGAVGVEAVLSTEDPGITMVASDAFYPDLSSGAVESPSSPFRIILSDVDGHRRIPFTLEIGASGGYSVTRSFILEVGTLENGRTVESVIQEDDQDDFHFYHLEVPAGARDLEIGTTSAQDVDLLVRYQEPPYFDFSCYGGTPPCVSEGTLSSVTDSGDERVFVSNPMAGTYYAAVLNYQQQPDTDYTIQAVFRQDETAQAADFTATPLSGPAPLDVRFTDLSTGEIEQWDWDFGDGQASTLRNPDHRYENPGTYTVTLEVTGTEGVSTRVREDYIRVSEDGLPDDLPVVGGSEAGSTATATIDTSLYDRFVLKLRQADVDDLGRLYIGVEIPTLEEWEDWMWFHARAEKTAPYLALIKDEFGFMNDAYIHYYYEGYLSATEEDLSFLVGGIRGLKDHTAVFRIWYLRYPLVFSADNLSLVQTVRVTFR